MLVTEQIWLQRIEQWEEYCIAAGHKPTTLRTRIHYLAILAGTHRLRPPESLTTDDLAQVLAWPGWEPETRKSARSAIRSFCRWMAATGRTPDDPSAALLPISVPRAVPRPAPKRVFVAAFAEADERGRRILSLARFGGLRRAEIAHARTDDVDEDGWLIIRGKGGHERRIPIHPTIGGWLAHCESGWLIPNLARGGPTDHLTPDHVGKLGNGWLPRGWSLHTLRHRAGTDWYAVERDLRAVQELLGHADPKTTALYTQIPRQSLVTAVMGVSA
jgi:integrase